MITEDLNIFLGDFENLVTYTPAGLDHPSGASYSVKCNLDEEYTDVNGVISQDPILETHYGQITSPALNDQVRVNHVFDSGHTDYLVKEIRPDGSGMFVLKLEEQ